MNSRFLWRSLVPAAVLAFVLVACGGGGGGSSSDSSTASASGSSSTASSSSSAASLDSNAVAVTVSSVLEGVNQPLVSVTVCEPGTDTCQTVDNVLLDSGSSGLRLFATALDSTFVSALTAQTQSGVALAECAHFGSGNLWGSVKQVDLVMNGEKASSLPVQIIGDTDATYTSPSACGNQYTKASDLGANGILGVNQLVADCGSGCESSGQGWYYTCTSGGTCTDVGVASEDQIPQPVSYFTSTGDSNGVVLVMDSVDGSGAASASGVLYFGIGTRSNNTPSSSVTVYDTDEYGSFSTATVTEDSTARTAGYGGYADTGSNGYFFPSGMTVCGDWYCPSSTTSVTATLLESGNTLSTSFSIGNAQTFWSTGYAALPELGGADSYYVDLGMPFFYGRTVYVAINGASTSLGSGPYIAY